MGGALNAQALRFSGGYSRATPDLSPDPNAQSPSAARRCLYALAEPGIWLINSLRRRLLNGNGGGPFPSAFDSNGPWRGCHGGRGVRSFSSVLARRTMRMEPTHSESLDWAVRLFVYRYIVENERPPTIIETADGLQLDPSRTSGAGSFRLAISPMVRGSHLHLSDDSVLPVGRRSQRLVRGEPTPPRGDSLAGADVGAGEGLVSRPDGP